MHEESPEGGRFKKEVFINDQSYLLLIRDEGGVPEAQVWGRVCLLTPCWPASCVKCIDN